MINKVILLGNLGKDPEIRNLESGGKDVRFPVATNENRRDKNGEWQQHTERHDITVRGVQAERAAQQLKKGSLIFLEGKITHRKWQDREGKDRYSTEIVANLFRNLDKRDSQRSESGQPAEDGDDQDAVSDDLPF
jgi:single-strand DNA-binding protein